MGNNMVRIDLMKLIKYVLKRIWLPILCGIIGFGGYYYHVAYRMPDTYTASGTMYVYNSNPNLINYQYFSYSDVNSALALVDVYTIVVRSNKVMDVVAERLSGDYPGIQPAYIAGTLSMSAVAETGVVSVRSVTGDPKLSADICNAVMDVAPSEIIRVVGAGNIEVIDYAMVPIAPDYRPAKRRGMLGALAGMVLGGGVLLLLFLMNRKVTDEKELTESYTPPILSSIHRSKKDQPDPKSFMLTDKSSMEKSESYAKLRMNLLYSLVGKESHSVEITSAISGEGKSTVAANLAISCALGGKKVLLVDSDMRRACQRDIFDYEKTAKGLSEILIGDCTWQEVVRKGSVDRLDLLPAGAFPPNPAELLASSVMQNLLKELENAYDLVILDMPPINIVTDPLVLSQNVAGCIYVIRQNFSDHRDIRKALIESEMTGMNVMGFVFYGEKVNQGSYYNRRYYKQYYSKYDYRRNMAEAVKRQQEKKEIH
ncbi:MAG: polysaccharide biosynthesis tyrosine autokinase [Blautia sp.]|nr:polysaccharide biosynthesis tyrosine autokinase [Blautia sp.]